VICPAYLRKQNINRLVQDKGWKDFLKSTRDICEKIISGEKNLEYLAEQIKFDIIKNGD